MPIKLTDGVNLHVMPTTKYKTVRMMLKFCTKLSKETITKRALLSSLFEINSKKYPTQTALRKELSDLYGASFGTSVSKKGTNHILTVGMNVVNEKYLSDEQFVLKDAIEFLKEVLFNPNAAGDQFDEKTFQREKENLADYYDSVFDDKRSYANLALQQLMFENVDHQTPEIGAKEDLGGVTAFSLYEYYQTLMNEDSVDIYVLGDVAEEKIADAFGKFPFQPRKRMQQTAFYSEEAAEEVMKKSEVRDIVQAKFNLGYVTDIFYQTESFYAGQVFNGLFGGYPHSKLFMNVREKESLAYYASSSLDTFRGTMSVQTGIEAQKIGQVEEIIGLQLKELQNGQFSEADLNQTKEMLKNQLLQSEDNPGAVIERIYASQLAAGKIISIDESLAKIEAVTKEQVQQVAGRIKLKATFFLTKETD